ncbi:MAG: hypothetical protein KBD01_11160 [Acidobacteria bacterium]|nr:hypothetical protein [Acidobacteriota bacterium]
MPQPAVPTIPAHAALEAILDALPVGSTVFADHVAAHLWPNPTPRQVKALACIAEGRSAERDRAVRETALAAVSVCQRQHRLRRAPPSAYSDPAMMQARAGEWARIAQLARDLAQRLGVPGDTGSVSSLAEAAALLLPDPLEIEAEAALAEVVQQIVDTALGGTGAGPALGAAPADCGWLLEAIATRTLGGSDPVFLDAWAVHALARADLAGGERARIERDRRAAAMVHERMEREVALLLGERSRDQQRKQRIASWRRVLRDTCTRLDEALTAPAADTAPAAHASGEQADEQIVEQLRSIRELAAAPEPAAAPRGWRRWLRWR